MGKLIDLSGNTYGRLIVESRDLKLRKDKNSYWHCVCQCGKRVSVRGAHLKDGGVPSCGCSRSEGARIQMETHGLTGTRILDVLSNMKKRCNDPDNRNYRDYGGRGIQICDRWMEPTPKGVQNLLEDMGNPPEGMSIDRIDNDGDYTPENCRWAYKHTQMANQRERTNNTSKYRGVYQDSASNSGSWISRLQYDNKTYRLGSYSSEEDAAKAYNRALDFYNVPGGVKNLIGE